MICLQKIYDGVDKEICFVSVVNMKVGGIFWTCVKDNAINKKV